MLRPSRLPIDCCRTAVHGILFLAILTLTGPVSSCATVAPLNASEPASPIEEEEESATEEAICQPSQLTRRPGPTIPTVDDLRRGEKPARCPREQSATIIRFAIDRSAPKRC